MFLPIAGLIGWGPEIVDVVADVGSQGARDPLGGSVSGVANGSGGDTEIAIGAWSSLTSREV